MCMFQFKKCVLQNMMKKLVLIWLTILQVRLSLRPGSSLQLQCPSIQKYNVSNVRTYAVALMNAQRNLQITLDYVLKEKQITHTCHMSKDNQLCLLDGFIQQFTLNCSEEGSASFLIVQPVMASNIAQEEALRHRSLVPILEPLQKGVVTYQSLTKIQKTRQILGDIFISNCIEALSYFQDEILIGVRQKPGEKCMIMLGDGFTGQWTFSQTSTQLHTHQVVESYLLATQEFIFTIEPKLITHGVRLLLRTQNQTVLQNLTISINATYRLPRGNQEGLQRSFQIMPTDLKGKVPIRLYFFFQEHPLSSFTLVSSESIHFAIQAVTHEEAQFTYMRPSGVQQSAPRQVETPVIEEDEHLFYAYQKFHLNTLQILAHIRKSYSSNETPLLRVITKNGHIRNANYFIQEKQHEIQITSNQIAPIQIQSQAPYAEFKLLLQITSPEQLQPLQPSNQSNSLPVNNNEVVGTLEVVSQPSTSSANSLNTEMNYHQNNILGLLLESSFDFKQIILDIPITEFLFENQIKRYFISQQKMSSIQVKKLYVECSGCYIYATYSPKCANIECCEYAHATLIDSKPQKLVIMVTAATHQQATALIHILITRGEDRIRLRDGQIYEGILSAQATYLFHSQVNDQIEIICNSGAESVLILANVNKNQFPTKQIFQQQSNEGFLRLANIKKETDVFIKLLPMNSASSSISYTLAIGSKLFPIVLIEGTPLHRRLKSQEDHHYVIEHACNPSQSIFLRISTKQNSLTLNPLSLKLRKKLGNQTAQVTEPFLIEEFNSSLTKQITSLFINNNSLQKQQICEIELFIVSSSLANIMSTVMFFTERQTYEIFTGKFNTDYLLADTPLHLYCVVDSSQPVVVYAYSMSEQFGMKVSRKSFKQLKELKDQKRSKHLFPIFTQEDANWESFSHHQYISAQSLQEKERELNLQVVLITLTKSTPTNDNFEKKPIHFVCTQYRTKMEQGSRLFYHLNPQQSHVFDYTISEQLLIQIKKQQLKNPQSKIESEIILQTSPLVGKFKSSIKLMSGNTEIGQFAGAIRNRDSFYQDASFLIVTLKEVMQILQTKQMSLDSMESGLVLSFDIQCLTQQDPGRQSKPCELMSSIQSSTSDVRELLPGWPEVFRINKHKSMIFIFNNAIDDRVFKFKINRKMGFPNYQICSSRVSYKMASESKNTCLESLQPREDDNVALFSDNILRVEQNLVLGRSHELVINQFSQNYCTNCTYYLALYSGYDLVEGSLFVMSAKQPTVLQSSSSITTIVYRDEPDDYLVASTSLVAVLYQIDGRVDIEVRRRQEEFQVYEWKEKSNHSLGNSESIVTIEVPSDDSTDGKNTGQNGFHLRLRPNGNSPSALYTLVVIDREEQQITLKDGVPYETSYAESSAALSSIIKYTYACQNQGTIMISTKKFDEVNIRALCLDENTKIQIPEPLNIANRIDIAINPFVCSKYQITVQALNPNISYTILASADDIVTLPLGKQLPGMLKYQSKLFQIYEVQVRQRTQLHCTMKFCQGGNGQVMIAGSKKQLQKELYEQQLDINQQTKFQSFSYTARPGVFYIKVQFKDRGGVLQYTLHVQPHSGTSREHQALSVYGNKTHIDYKLSKVNSKYSEFEVGFYPLVVSLEQFEISYYVIESNQLDLLHRTQNCNGQYFAETVSHHQEISARKVDLSSQLLQQISLKPRKITFKYRTSSPYNFITIVPVIYHRSTRAYYHLFVPKYSPVQLKNGQAFSSITFFLGDLAMQIEKYIDIHDSQKTVFMIGIILASCCCLTLLIGGVWLGRLYFVKVRTVYVMRDVSQEQNRLADQSEAELDTN